MGVPRAIYASTGAAINGTVPGRCRLCGEEGRGRASIDWLKPTFTDHDKIQPGEIVCAACLFCVDDHSEILQRMTGRDKPQRMRNYSHVVRPDGTWCAYMKNQKRELAAELLASPLAAVVSLAGQKHLILRARMGWWQVEETTLRPEPESLGSLLPRVEALYSAGATKAEIETGRYRQSTLLTLGLDFWREHENNCAPFRGTGIFSLAVWLAQKETDDADS